MILSIARLFQDITISTGDIAQKHLDLTNSRFNL